MFQYILTNKKKNIRWNVLTKKISTSSMLVYERKLMVVDFFRWIDPLFHS